MKALLIAGFSIIAMATLQANASAMPCSSRSGGKLHDKFVADRWSTLLNEQPAARPTQVAPAVAGNAVVESAAARKK